MALNLHATSTNTATAGEVNIQVGYANVAYAKAEANAGGATNAYVQEGASIHATGLSVLADATNNATANSFATSLGPINVSIAQPTAETTHTVQAYIGPPKGTAPNTALSGTINVGNSQIQVHATSLSNLATVQAIAIKLGDVAVSVEQPRVTVGGATTRLRRWQIRDHDQQARCSRQRSRQCRNRQFRQHRGVDGDRGCRLTGGHDQ